MEPLLLVLFLLFSVVSALLERRKRRQQVEEAAEAQQRQAARSPRDESAPVAVAQEEEEEREEEWGGWPFPPGDPFEQTKAKARPKVTSPPAEPRDLLAPTTSDGQALTHQIEVRQVRQVRPPSRVAEMTRQRRAKEAGKPLPKRVARRYRLSAKTARDAVVYAEILGPCKAEREQEWRW